MPYGRLDGSASRVGPSVCAKPALRAGFNRTSIANSFQFTPGLSFDRAVRHALFLAIVASKRSKCRT